MKTPSNADITVAYCRLASRWIRNRTIMLIQLPLRISWKPSRCTMKEIVAVLNQHGQKNQCGGELNLNSVSRLLQNRFYIGEYKYREITVPDVIPAIIPKDLFNRVQEKLAKNKKAPARHKAEDDYLLTTKLFCGDCQSLMFGESGTSQSGATYHYYKCSNAKKKTGCNRKPVKKKWIEDAVLAQVKTVLNDNVFIK